jgi:hypothetical protein
MKKYRFRGAAIALLTLQLAGCGGDTAEQQPPADDTQPAATESAPPRASSAPPPAESAPTAAEQPLALTVADIDAYAQGLHREIELLRSARQRYRQAESDAEQLEILGEIQPGELRREGAAAAGVPADRYRRITSAVNDVLGRIEMTAAARDMMPSRAEIEDMPPEHRARVEENIRQMQASWGDPYAGLSPEAAQALQQRTDELARLRAEHIGLLAQRT